ncbi:gibberellin A4 carboxyl methyltransferase [Salvia divinorum]|uniref:Gibberellin A4 carboxyl methyltransferase n=1 Tax=Salvia divinorum TaxID=28513 RepID=A0ABD1GFE2_SALDI
MGETFPMKGGDGAHSYAKNSQYQKKASDSVKGMIDEAVIESLERESMSGTVAIADLGCSVGPNTFFSVQNLMEAVQKKWPSETLEFQVFFNDNFGNDFNALFAALPPERGYHAAGVAGSFHGRLFPRNSITVVHSSHALHWLSKQPQGVPNEGRIHYVGAPDEVVRAYSDQFKEDFKSFIVTRAAEVVRGGVMLLILPATREGVPTANYPAGFLFSYLGQTLMDLANEGVVDKGKIDGFNLPIYVPSVGEVRKMIEKNGCFTIEKMELTKPRGSDDGPIDVPELIMHLRGGMQEICALQFGDYAVEKMFDKMSEKRQHMSEFMQSNYRREDGTQLFLVLKRK